MKYKLVYIEWEDAMAYKDSPWMSFSKSIEWGKQEEYIIKECGFILHEDNNFILLADKMTDETNNKETMFCDLQKIPKTWIRKRKLLKL